MEKMYQKYRFSAISIKKNVAGRFREFSQGVSSSHTGTLEAMLDFFEIHQLSPLDSIEGSLSSVEIRIKRRISATISIIKNIEKNQTQPTAAMLQSLFQQHFEQEDKDEDDNEDFEFIEKKFADVKEKEEWLEETTIPRIRYERLEEKMDLLKQEFAYVLDKVKEVKISFGKDYLKLELSPEEIEKYKRTIKNI